MVHSPVISNIRDPSSGLTHLYQCSSKHDAHRIGDIGCRSVLTRDLSLRERAPEPKFTTLLPDRLFTQCILRSLLMKSPTGRILITYSLRPDLEGFHLCGRNGGTMTSAPVPIEAHLHEPRHLMAQASSSNPIFVTRAPAPRAGKTLTNSSPLLLSIVGNFI
jgi:hypothetical protein